jgi:hypothetical protein
VLLVLKCFVGTGIVSPDIDPISEVVPSMSNIEDVKNEYLERLINLRIDFLRLKLGCRNNFCFCR